MGAGSAARAGAMFAGVALSLGAGMPATPVPDPLIGRLAQDRILAPEPVRSERLADPATGAGLNVLVPSGSRAITVLLDDPLLEGVRPGLFVDVLGDVAWLDARGRWRPVLEDVLVLASREPGLGAPDWEPGSVTLATTVSGAEALTLAEHQGSLRLSIRNSMDTRSMWRRPEYTGCGAQYLRTERPDPRTGAGPTSRGDPE